MNRTRGQFIVIWIIYGFALLFALEQTVLLLKELITLAGMKLDIAPGIVKYSQAFCYFLAWVAILLILIKIIRGEGVSFTDIRFRKFRHHLLIFVIVGIVAQVATEYVIKARRAAFRPYLNRHDSSMVEFLNQSQVVKIIPILLIAATLFVAFFVLTREEE